MYILGIMYMLGNKKHVLKLRDSLLVLIEIVGPGRDAKPKKEAKGLQKWPKAPSEPSAGVRMKGALLPFFSSL